jgi:hypothetical protein
MKNKSINKYIAGFGLSVIITSFFNAVLLIVKETNPPLKQAMAAAMGHHWTTHGAAVILVFIILGLILSWMKIATKWHAGKMGNYIMWAVVISSIILGGFYLTHL